MRSRRRKVLVACVAALLIGAVMAGMVFSGGGAASGTPTPERSDRREPPVDPSRELALEASLGEAEIWNMVSILKTAILKGDKATQEAMREGLKGERQTAQKILRREIGRASRDEQLRAGLEQTLRALMSQ